MDNAFSTWLAEQPFLVALLIKGVLYGGVALLAALLLDAVLLLVGLNGIPAALFAGRIRRTLRQYRGDFTREEPDVLSPKVAALHEQFAGEFAPHASEVGLLVDPLNGEVNDQQVRVAVSVAILSPHDQAILSTTENLAHGRPVGMTARRWLNRDYDNGQSLETLRLGSHHQTVRPYRCLIFPVAKGTDAASHIALHTAIVAGVEQDGWLDPGARPVELAVADFPSLQSGFARHIYDEGKLLPLDESEPFEQAEVFTLHPDCLIAELRAVSPVVRIVRGIRHRLRARRLRSQVESGRPIDLRLGQWWEVERPARFALQEEREHALR